MEQLPQPQYESANFAVNSLKFVLDRLKGGAWGELATNVKGE